MTARSLCRLFTASLMFSVVALNTIVGNAQIPTRTPDWVNIKDPEFRGDRQWQPRRHRRDPGGDRLCLRPQPAGGILPGRNLQNIQPDYLDPPGNLRTNPTNPPLFQFHDGVHRRSSWRRPSAPERMPDRTELQQRHRLHVGTGQSMRVSDIAVIGPGERVQGRAEFSWSRDRHRQRRRGCRDDPDPEHLCQQFLCAI